MGFNIDKIGGVVGAYNSQKIESKKDVYGTSQIKGKKDEVKISKEAMDFQLVMKAVREAGKVPDVREEVIAPIKERVDDGTYEVDSRSIADKLLARKFNLKV